MKWLSVNPHRFLTHRRQFTPIKQHHQSRGRQPRNLFNAPNVTFSGAIVQGYAMDHWGVLPCFLYANGVQSCTLEDMQVSIQAKFNTSWFVLLCLVEDMLISKISGWGLIWLKTCTLHHWQGTFVWMMSCRARQHSRHSPISQTGCPRMS